MLDTDTKRRIDTARDILVGKVPDPKSQVEQITIALIYKFMDDMDAESEELGGKRKFFTKEFARYGWAKLMDRSLGGHEMLALYGEGISKMPENPGIPPLFRDIFKNAYLPYRDPETLKAFLKIIDEFSYDHSERLGDAFEYLLSVLGSQGDAGQFRTPRHIIDFMVDVVDPKKGETILDPACGTAGFLISAYKHILRANTSGGARCPTPSPPAPLPKGEGSHFRGGYDFAGLKKRARELRGKQTDAETLLWDLLRDRQLSDAKFRRQHQFGDYICDFYCHEAKLVVECDGDVHQTAERRQLDAKRDTYLKSQGLTVLRFQNNQILQDPEPILEAIAQHFLLPSPSPSPFGRGGGEGTQFGRGGGEGTQFGRGAGGEGSPTVYGVGRLGELLTPDERGRLAKNIRGYDISPDMVRLSLVNLYLHGFTDPHIYEYDTLTSEERWNEFADVILANPPFMSPKGGIKPHKRFSIQAKRSEVLFVDYMAEHLTPNGRAAIIVPEGIIFQSQTAYKDLRKMLVENSLVAVVSLPAGCFNPYSGVKTSILILDKSLAKQSETIAFFKVENDGFGLGAQRRAIEKNDLPQVQTELAAYLQDLCSGEPSPVGRGQGEGSAGLIVPKTKIAVNGDYNLSGERYRVGVVSSSSFPSVALGEVCELVRGVVFSKEDEVTEGGVQVLRANNINKDRYELNLDDIRRVSPKTDFSDEKKLRKDDIFICLASGSKDHVGKVAFIKDDTDFYFGGFMGAIRVKPGRLYAGYLLKQLTTGHFNDFLREQIAGANINNLSGGLFYRFQIPLPPLEIQKEIVAEIEGYQKVINGARAVLDNYRPHIPIHPDWPMVELSEVIESKPKNGYSGNPVDHATNLKVLSLSATTSGKMDLSKFKYLDEAIPIDAPCRCRRGDIYLQRGNTKELVGTAAIFDTDEENYVYPDLMIRVRADQTKIQSHYLLTVLQSGPVREFVTRNAVGAAGSMPKINQGIVERIPIPLPPLATQQVIVAEIATEQVLVNSNRELIARFEKKIQSTLARIWGTPSDSTD